MHRDARRNPSASVRYLTASIQKCSSVPPYSRIWAAARIFPELLSTLWANHDTVSLSALLCHLFYSSSLPYSRDSGKAKSEKGSCQPKPQEPFLNLWIEFSPVSRKGLPAAMPCRTIPVCRRSIPCLPGAPSPSAPPTPCCARGPMSRSPSALSMPTTITAWMRTGPSIRSWAACRSRERPPWWVICCATPSAPTVLPWCMPRDTVRGRWRVARRNNPPWWLFPAAAGGALG